MADASPRSAGADPQVEMNEEARTSREWVKPEIVTLDLETAQATGGGIPGG